MTSTTGPHSRASTILSRLPLDRPVSVAEVGVYEGRMSRSLLCRHSRLRLFMVDPWSTSIKKNAVDEISRSLASSQEACDRARAAASKNISQWRDRAVILRMTSEAAAKRWCDGLLDLVFIDADHTYESVSRDLEAWWPIVKPGGWLSGHDIGDKRFPGVHKAVSQFASARGLIFERDANFTYHIRKPADAEAIVVNDEPGAMEPEDMDQDEDGLLIADGFDDAVLGVVVRFNQEFVLYDYEKCIEILMDRDGCSREDAEEHMGFNVVGAWAGDKTPGYLHSKTLDEIRDGA